MDYQATDKLNINFGALYNQAEESWTWPFTERAPMTGENLPGTPLNSTGNEVPGMFASVEYDDYLLNNLITSYSDLEYQQYELTLGGTYDFTKQLYTTTSLTYEIFESDQMYVYGDEEGEAFRGHLAVGYKF